MFLATRVPLRSAALDPVAIPGRRLFVTAQCGGLGTEADDAVAVVDLAAGGAAELDVFFPAPRDDPVAALAGFHFDPYFIDEHSNHIQSFVPIIPQVPSEPKEKFGRTRTFSRFTAVATHTLRGR